MKQFISLLAGIMLLFSGVTLADNSTSIKETSDLQALGEQARDRGLPILVVFSQSGCAYCVVLEENYLLPMLRSGDYQDKVIIRKVKIDSFDTLRNFDGSKVDVTDLADKYHAFVTPTMVFIDHNGNELARRLMGIGTEGFFAGQIDEAIDTSLNRLRSVALKQE